VVVEEDKALAEGDKALAGTLDSLEAVEGHLVANIRYLEEARLVDSLRIVVFD